MSNIFLLFPVHLFKNVEILKKYDEIVLVEEPIYFTKYKFHKLKLCFHRASMKKYYDYIESKKLNIKYFNFDDEYYKYIKNKNVSFYNPVDHDLIEKINKMSKKYSFDVTMFETQGFITSKENLLEYHTTIFNKKFSMTSSFYRWQRKRLNIMYPIGSKNKLSYDNENREPFKKNEVDVFDPNTLSSEYILDAILYVNKHFKNNFGSLDNFIYPIDHKGAEKWLDDFIRTRFKKFGIYEDAFDKNIKFGFHSVLSPLLNIGLLTDNDVIQKILPLKSKIPISSFEGYIRQVIGWKQSIRYLYEFHYKKFYKKNFLKHKNTIGKKIWNGNTGLPPVDNCIEKAKKIGYLHHIERLMVMGNFFLITMIDPDEVFEWFISIVSMDAYQWVMYPNIYGMIMYADGGFMMSRPYMSSSSYLKKMGNYNTIKQIIKLKNVEYTWDVVWDFLYYNFINKHYDLLKKNYFTSRNVYHWDNKTNDEKKEILKVAKQYLKYLHE